MNLHFFLSKCRQILPFWRCKERFLVGRSLSVNLSGHQLVQCVSSNCRRYSKQKQMSLEIVSDCAAVIVSDEKESILTENTIMDISAPAAKKAKITEERLTVRFVKISQNAHAPTYGSAAAAGADLYSAENVIVPAKGKYCVSTDLNVELPFGYYGRVAPRSGLAAKNFIDVGAGVVDSDYRGVLKVLLFNFSDQDFEVKIGDRIAQFICERIAHCNYVEVVSLEDTERGAGGFGSTGV